MISRVHSDSEQSFFTIKAFLRIKLRYYGKIADSEEVREALLLTF